MHVVSRPPLKRMREHPTAVALPATQRPPLQRRRVQLVANTNSVGLQFPDINVPTPPLAARLLEPAVLKLQPPLRMRMRYYWEYTVQPLCCLLGVTPRLLARRGEDQGIMRLAYNPGRPAAAPCTLCVAYEDTREFDRNLVQIADHFVFCCYLAFNVVNLVPYDIDADTSAGSALRRALIAAVEYAAKRTLISSAHVGFIMLEKAHCAVVCQPTYIAAALAIGEEMHELLSRSLSLQQASGVDALSPRVQLTIDSSLTITLPMLQGGGKRARPHVPPADAAFDPTPQSDPRCLYAAVLFAADIEIERNGLQLLRESVHDALFTAQRQGTTIAGRRVEEWAHSFSFTPEDYISHTDQAPLRMGNACDAWLCASILGNSIWIVGSDNVPIMLSHACPPRYVIRQAGDHFYVSTVDSQEILSTCTPRLVKFEFETPATASISLNQPRTGQMMYHMHRLLRASRMDVPGIDRLVYRYFASEQAHMRIYLMVPVFNYNTVLEPVPQQEAVTLMNGICHTRHLPTWTAIARVLVEVELAPVSFDAVEEMVQKIDLMTRHCLLDEGLASTTCCRVRRV
eukprot:360515-Amphidinium_carterae.1